MYFHINWFVWHSSWLMWLFLNLHFCNKFQGWFFFQLFSWFQLFFCEREIQKITGHSQNRSKMTFLKEGVDGFSYFHWFSIILFSIQNHPWSSVRLMFVCQHDLTFQSIDWASLMKVIPVYWLSIPDEGYSSLLTEHPWWRLFQSIDWASLMEVILQTLCAH